MADPTSPHEPPFGHHPGATPDPPAPAIDPDAYPGVTPPPPAPPPPPPAPRPARPDIVERAYARVRGYFLDFDPSFWSALAPLVLLAIALYTRSPTTNYIFDEQEALLANPYVNATGDLGFLDAIHRDFWGLPPERSVGSYRPLPNFVWRALWSISKQPFLHHFYNVLLHAVNGAVLTCIAFSWTRRRGLAYLAGFTFVACAVLTEAVSGIVGIADVLGGLGALLALAALALPAWLMPFAVFLAVSAGLFSKESALVCVPLVPMAALVTAPLTHPARPARVLRLLLALLGAAAAFVLYVELRRRWFPSPTPAELEVPLPDGASAGKRAMRAVLLWFHQAPLPRDPLNNPLAEADTPHRIAGALRVYWRGLVQVVFPRSLSGDYSYPQEPVPDRLIFPESVLGGAMMVLPPLASVGLWVGALLRERRDRLARTVAEGAAAAASEAGAPERVAESRRPWMLLAGAALVLASIGVGLLEALVILPSGTGLLASLPPALWPLPFLPTLCVGLGLLAESSRPRVSPDAPAGPRPLGYAGACAAAVGLTWIVVSFFPHSNIPVVLPTVRAERFWYFPALGSSLVLAVLFTWLHRALRDAAARRARVPAPLSVYRENPEQPEPEVEPRLPTSLRGWLTPGIVAVFFVIQCVQAYRHAMDYRSDLDFWDATRRAVPDSAKAHLNYSVMKGARGDLQARLESSLRAMELAPRWPMAHVYTGDTLCRMGRADEAWPHYKKGFELGPNELSLIALALQCLHDQQKLYNYEAELRALAEEHPGSWIAFLGPDTLDNSKENNGVDPKYRPRGYNEGPKE